MEAWLRLFLILCPFSLTKQVNHRVYAVRQGWIQYLNHRNQWQSLY